MLWQVTLNNVKVSTAFTMSCVKLQSFWMPLVGHMVKCAQITGGWVAAGARFRWAPSGGLGYPTHTHPLIHDAWFSDLKCYEEAADEEAAAEVAGHSKLKNVWLLCTLKTRYNVIQYNAHSVITRLQCWLPFRWELHPATVSTAGRDAWSNICRPPALCNTRWNAAAAAWSTLYMYVQRSSLQEGEGGVSNE